MIGNGDPHHGRVEFAIVALLVLSGLGLPAAMASSDLDEPTPWRVEHAVEARVVDNYATVNVSIEVENDAGGPQFPFEVAVPEDAYITGLAITRNNTTYEADVEPASAARETYDAARQQGRSAGLVEQARDRSTYRYNLNVEPNQTVEAVLTYETYLVAEEGSYELPLVAPATPYGVDEGATFRVELQHARGIEAIATDPEAPIANTDDGYRVTYETGYRGLANASSLDVAYETEGTEPGGRLVATLDNETGYFAHRFQARGNESRAPVDLALVLDRSGSMGGDKIDQMRAATRQVVDHLDERDRVHVTSFADGTRSAWEGFRAVDNDTARGLNDTLASLQAGGSTNVEEAIREGLARFPNDTGDDRRLQAAAFLTDGKATKGIQDNQRLRELAREQNDLDAHVFGLAFGSGADWGLVHGLAEDSEGYAERVPAGQGAELDLERFLTRLTSPVLTNVTVSYQDASVQSWRIGAPVLFEGSELVYVGTFDPELDTLNATVDAHGAERSIQADVSAAVEADGPAYLSQLVAYQRVRALEDRIDAHGEREAWVDNATRLALEHGFVTERTSLVVDLPRQEPDLDEETDGAGSESAAGGTSTAVADDAHGAAHDTNPADTDGDAIPSASDACPGQPGSQANDGCPADPATTQHRSPGDGEGDQDAARAPVESDETPHETPGPGATGLLLVLGVLARIARDERSR